MADVDEKHLAQEVTDEKPSAADVELGRDASSADESEKNLDVDVEKHAADADVTAHAKNLEEGDGEVEIDPNVVDWDGPDDPESPYNWPKSKKWRNGAALSAFTLIT